MTLTMYKNNSDERVVDKELTTIADNVTFNLLASTSIENPVLSIQFDVNYLQCNYIYIAEFNRYYYCNVTVDHYNLMTVTCNVDVLMSFKNQIRETTQIIDRTSFTPITDSMLYDSEFQLRSKKKVQQKVINNDVFKPDTFGNRTSCFVLTTINGYLESGD